LVFAQYEVSISDLEAKIPMEAEKNDVIFESTAGEQRIPLGSAMRHAAIVAEFPPLSAPKPLWNYSIFSRRRPDYGCWPPISA
jgi:hypothetical protein